MPVELPYEKTVPWDAGAELGFIFKALPKLSSMEKGFPEETLALCLGRYRGETADCYIVDITSVRPTINGARIRKDDLAFIGELSKLG